MHDTGYFNDINQHFWFLVCFMPIPYKTELWCPAKLELGYVISASELHLTNQLMMNMSCPLLTDVRIVKGEQLRSIS